MSSEKSQLIYNEIMICCSQIYSECLSAAVTSVTAGDVWWFSLNARCDTAAHVQKKCGGKQLLSLPSSGWFRAMSLVAAAETHGRAAEFGQRHGRLLPQQRPEPAQLGLLWVHRHDPRGEWAVPGLCVHMTGGTWVCDWGAAGGKPDWKQQRTERETMTNSLILREVQTTR